MASSSASGFSVRQAPYALNRDRLCENLVAAASSDTADVSVEVKDTGGSVGLQCSPAFLKSVVMGFLLTLSAGYTRVVEGWSS